MIAKIAATIVIVIAIGGLTTQMYMQSQPKQKLDQMKFGVSFSQKMSEGFGLDWKENYLAILNDLHPAAIRIMAYWDQIEPEKDKWDFTALDWQVDEAKKANIPVVIAVGQKIPRWPECHFPSWIDQKNDKTLRAELLIYEKKVLERYKDSSNLLYWQIENEPYVPFGPCPKSDKNTIEAEINLARQIDPNHKILLTDGGEWGKWYNQVKDGDVFGTTLYRKVYKKGVGSIHPPLTPEYYDLKRSIVASLAGKKNEHFVISELGAEPWWGKQIYELPLAQQKELLTNYEIDQFVDFARRTNIDTVYFWGSEWWYYMKTQDDPSYWNHIKNLMNP